MWLELGIGFLELKPQDYWNLTIYELNIKTKNKKKYLEEQNRRLLLSSYYSGAFSQADLKKFTVDKWVEMLTPEEERTKKKLEEFEEAKNLWHLANHLDQQ